MLVLEGGTLIDGQSDAPLPNCVIFVENNLITAVGQKGTLDYPTSAQTLDITGKTILPGLIDAHVHDLGDRAIRAYLYNGITSVKDAGSAIAQSVQQRQQIDSGEKAGPRLFIIGPIVDGKPSSYPPLSLEVESPPDAREKVRKLITENNTDGLLIGQRMDGETLRAVVDVTREYDLLVSGQIWRIGGKEACLNGINALENTSRLPETIHPDQPELIRFDEPLSIAERIGRLARLWMTADEQKLSELIDLMIERSVYWIPTLVTFQKLYLLHRPELRSLDELASPYRSMWENEQRYASWGNTEFDNLSLMLSKLQAFTGRFRQAGGVVIAGTDNPNPYTIPGVSLHQELELLVESGLTPMQAIQSATRDAARFLGRRAEKLGIIAPGKLADLIVVDGDPLADIRATRAIHTVIQDGRIIDRQSLLS